MNGLSVLVTIVLFLLASQLSLVLHQSGATPKHREAAAKKELQLLDASKHRTTVVNL